MWKPLEGGTWYKLMLALAKIPKLRCLGSYKLCHKMAFFHDSPHMSYFILQMSMNWTSRVQIEIYGSGWFKWLTPLSSKHIYSQVNHIFHLNKWSDKYNVVSRFHFSTKKVFNKQLVLNDRFQDLKAPFIPQFKSSKCTAKIQQQL